jgi:hypothetical protein
MLATSSTTVVVMVVPIRRSKDRLPRGQIFVQVVPKTFAAKFSVEATR